MPSVKICPGMIVPLTRLGSIVLRGIVVILLAADALAAEPHCPAVGLVHLELPVTRAAISRNRPITVVALGSSSTEGAGASAPDRTYPARLDALLHMSWPGAAVTIRNKGVGGQTVDAVMARLDADVLAEKPTLVIWQVGTNEALRGMDPAYFEARLDEGLRRIAAIGSDVILMDYQIAPRMPAQEKRAEYRAIIAKEAAAHGVSLFSRADLMRAWLAIDPGASDMIGPDGLHQSDRGYACLAASLDSAIVAATAPRIAAVKVNLK